MMLEIRQQNALRTCLKQLFHSQNPDEIIHVLTTNITLKDTEYKKFLYSGLTSLSKELGYSFDQCSLIADWFIAKFGHDVFLALGDFGNSNLIDSGHGVPIVKIDCLLRWNELASYLTEDLITCAHFAYGDIKKTNISFNWDPFLSVNSDEVVGILTKKLSDVHAHLKGSSLNFDVNWICLMNHIVNRSGSFRDLEEWRQSTYYNRTFSQKHSLYEKAIMAASIRLLLFGDARSINLISDKRVNTIINTSGFIESLSLASDLQKDIDVAKTLYAKSYHDSEQNRSAKIDYALFNGISIDDEKCAYSSLAGERYILYSALCKIKGNELYRNHRSSLLYLYILIKNEIRNELIQTNDAVGFDNFNVYERRKTLFIEKYPEYEELLVHLSVAGFFAKRSSDSCHETRIAPKSNYSQCLNAFLDTDKMVTGSLYCNATSIHSYGYDYHFIKLKDKTPERLYAVYERHHDLRREVKKQSLNIARLRDGQLVTKKDVPLSDLIVGIDAANSELNCRPEVFAQAFRYLRRHKSEHPEIHAAEKLGITYHVGEDFVDVIDGLRAIDELLTYMPYNKGDRLGHALVLGVDVPEYYARRNYSICMTKQMLLDNIVWLHHVLITDGGYKQIVFELQKCYSELIKDVFDVSNAPSIETYYDSWRLRGDDPEMYTPEGSVNTVQLGEWNNCSLNEGLDNVRVSKQSCLLYYRYHYDDEVKKKGAEVVDCSLRDFKCTTDSLVESISFVQHQMLKKVRNMGLCIECNPTSNFKIGEINRYDQHPIHKFYPYKKSPKRYWISSSINTDDKGIFATSIEREYALIYAAFQRKIELEKGSWKHTVDIEQWLDEIREFSNKQCFIKET